MKRRDLIEAIQALREAITNVEQNWSQGDLASAVQMLSETAEWYADPALAWWKADQADDANREIDRINAQADRINSEDNR